MGSILQYLLRIAGLTPDPRGVKTHYSYQLGGGGHDPLNRIQSRTFDTTSGMTQPGLPIDNTWGSIVGYEYMTAGDRSRIKKITTANVLTEEYSYDSQARVSEYKQTINGRETKPMTVNYLYDTLDRVTEVTYPAQYGLTGSPRKIVAHSYDTASRLTSMTYGGAQQAGDVVYNAADQTTSIKIGAAGANQVTEQYTFDAQTGLLTNQKATKNGSTTMLDLSYDYQRSGSVGSLNGKTGHLTKIVDNLNTNKNREYEFDALGRLTKAKGGTTGTLWNQTYIYDRYGNRTNVAKSGVAADGSPIPMDGIPNLSYDNTSNRITTTGYEYDVAGNQIRSLAADGVTWVKYLYDGANRIRAVYKDDAGPTLLQAFSYGATNARLIAYDNLTYLNTFYASVGGTTLAEYVEYGGVFTWTKSYTYLGDTQLATVTPNGGNEYVEFNHPDRLGTRLKTNQTLGTSYEQATMPFGTALNAESTLTDNNKRFTSYDRSAPTGLDYAINRTYDSKLGRFSQIDPIGMESVDFDKPQTLNMYSYCGNDPVNHVDPEGLFFGKLFKWIWKNLKKILAVVAVVVAVIAVIAFPWSGPVTIKAILGLVASLASAASSVLDLAGFKTLSKVFGIIAMAAGIAALGFEVKNAWQKLKKLRSEGISFADDPFINEVVTVNISGFWDKIASAVGSVSNQISTAVGSMSLLASKQGINSSSAGAANDPSLLKCLSGVWWRSVPKTVETIVFAESGKAVIGGGVLLGRFQVVHGLGSGNVMKAADGLKTGKVVGGGMSLVGGIMLRHAAKTWLSNSANSINGIKKCVGPAS